MGSSSSIYTLWLKWKIISFSGVGDTGGIKKDRLFLHNLKMLFSDDVNRPLESLDAICIVSRSGGNLTSILLNPFLHGPRNLKNSDFSLK